MEVSDIFNTFDKEKLKGIQNLNEIINLHEKIENIYFTNYKQERNNLLKDSIFELLKLIDSTLQDGSVLSKYEISCLYCIKSFALDKLPEYSKQSEESASKSLKLNPFVADNFNCIAHILWKKPDIEQAISYFKNALDLDPQNKTALRSLSMIIRTRDMKDMSQEKRIKLAEEAISYAKNAIKVDMKDPTSWYILGNAYFFKAFTDKVQYNDLELALKSYNQSQAKTTKYKNPDLYYNRGVVHAYLENYKEAYADFIIANDIDETLKSKDICKNIIGTVSNINKLIRNQGGLKPKNLAQIVNKIPTKLRDEVKLELAHTSQLVEGKNTNKIITGKIILHAESGFEVPISLIGVDYQGEFVCLNFYNISKDFLSTINYKLSSFVIVEPVLKKIILDENYVRNLDKSLTEKDKISLSVPKIYEYPCFIINDLNSCLVDGKICNQYQSNATLNSTFFN